jgi:hypothetical protein
LGQSGCQRLSLGFGCASAGDADAQQTIDERFRIKLKTPKQRGGKTPNYSEIKTKKGYTKPTNTIARTLEQE